MFTGILLACSLDGHCIGTAGPAVNSLKECNDSLQIGWIMFEEAYPHMIVQDAKCVAWGERA
jgi:hypothetical protein|tara:strand:+ start:1789 stop:1974 length:186 start_codon:yes stop_codon:yes gene_type:complete